MSDTTRRFPGWLGKHVDLLLLTEVRLATLRAEAQECDEHNARAYEALRQAYEVYAKAARDFGGGATIRRNGRTYIAAPSPPFNTATRAVDDIERRFAEETKRRAEEAKRSEYEAEQAKRRRAADIDLAKMIVRYGAPEDTDWDGMLALLRARNKYLDLAIAGMETREAWSDGFYRVADALARFKIEDDRDKEIVADLAGCMDSDDGRVFRDTTWSYDRLFALVEDQLVADAKRCCEMASR